MMARLIKNRLGYRLVLLSLVIGSVLSLLSTAAQLAFSYRQHRQDTVAVLDQIRQAQIPSLELALWTFDTPLIESILDGIATHQSIAHIDLKSETGQYWERGAPVPSPLTERFELFSVDQNGAPNKVGSLQLEVSLASVNALIWRQFWVTLLTNLAKAYLAAVVLLYVVHRLITRHLNDIATYVDGSDLAHNSSGLRLDRKTRAPPDDLDRIVHAIGDYEQRATTSLGQLQTEIKERTKNEEDVRAALSVHSNFVGTMSHEVRTPLNAILGFLHLIENAERVPAKQRNYARVATKAAQQLHNQLTNVLELSRIDSKGVIISTRPTRIEMLARQWQDNAIATVHFHRKPIEVALILDPALDEQYVLDGVRLTQIVTNLIDNAAKFTDSGKIRISVRTVRQPDMARDTHGLEISVADTGDGIEPGKVSRIFDRFEQSNGSIERPHGGSGLGLTISRQIATLMGAQLDVRNAIKDGYSTEFVITLDSNVRLCVRND